MQRQQLPMSITEYEALPKPFGYKVEYWGGNAVFTPRDCPVNCQLAITERLSVLALTSVTPDASLQTALTQGFFAAFNNTMEFCDWREEAIWAHAEKSVADYFIAKRGKPHPFSRVVLDNAGNVHACALLVEQADGKPELDLLFVHPKLQRQGIARSLANSIINQLYQQGITQLFSTYHICNESSRAWHEAMGFEPLPQGCYAQLSYAWYSDEYYRLRTLHPEQEYPELQEKMGYWQQQAKAWWRSFE